MTNLLDLDKLSDFVEEWWDKSALPSLCEFVEIPALSPSFDSDWESNGYLDAAVETFIAWTRSLPLKGLTISVHRLKNRSPLLLILQKSNLKDYFLQKVLRLFEMLNIPLHQLHHLF